MKSSGVSRILDLVREGRITPHQAAMLLEIRDDILRASRRRAFWRGFVDGLALGPLRRWLARRWRR